MVYAVLFTIALLISIIVIRTVRFKAKKYDAGIIEDIKIDIEKAAKDLSEVVKIKTVSRSDYSTVDWIEFQRLLKFIKDTYPLVHEMLEWETVNEYSLLYKWRGRDGEQKPGLLLGHMDVVPVEEGTEKDWAYPPFGGDIKDGFVWGRGTLDIKIQVVMILEAVEKLLSEGYTPERDIYLAFGHDEEVGGIEGAAHIADLLKSRNIEFEYVLDEGGCVTLNAVPGIIAPVAVLGIAEKGYANIKLIAEDTGGHSSMPPKHTAAGMIGKAISDIEKHQCNLKLTKPVLDMLSFIGPEMSLSKRIIIANLWLFGPLFKKIFSSSPSGNALLRTTTAVTMMEGSMEPNVLPQKASAVVNFRIAPGETGDELLEHIKDVINNPNIRIEPLRLEDPSKVSPVDSWGFKMIERSVYRVFPEAVVAPYLVLAGTDSRKFENVCSNIYRFSPYKLDLSDLKRMHGTNECISFENIERCIRFYFEVLKQ